MGGSDLGHLVVVDRQPEPWIGSEVHGHVVAVRRSGGHGWWAGLTPAKAQGAGRAASKLA
jgi:hypothetical protein